MELHKRFILDIWKSAAYYDFQQSFKVPDTFYLYENRIEWIFTGKNGKFLKKKQDNSTVTFVKDFFCKVQKDEKENELNNNPVASQFLACYKEKICYFHYLDLSGICELLVDSFRKNQDQDQINTISKTTSSNLYEQSHDLERNSQYKINYESQALINSQQYINQSKQINDQKDAQYYHQEYNSKELQDKTIVIQSYQTDQNFNNMIKIEWSQNGKLNIQKRINNFESFRKEDEYKKYIIFEDEDMSVNGELNIKEKQQLFQIFQHVVNSLQLIHNERGKVAKLTLLLKQINNIFYLITCSVLQFDNDQSLPQQWRISYDFRMKYPNKAIHIQNVLNNAESFLKKIEKNRKVSQCNCCKNFSSSLKVISSTKLIQIRTRRGIGISQYEINQLKMKDQSNVCEVCYQIFLEIHRISNQISENNLNPSYSIAIQSSASVAHSHRGDHSARGRYSIIDSNTIREGNLSRNKRSQTKFDCSSKQTERENSSKIENLYSSYEFSRNPENNQFNYQSVQPRQYLRENSSIQLKDYSSVQVRCDKNIQHRDYSSQKCSQKLPPTQFKLQKNNNYGKEQRQNNYENSTADTKSSLKTNLPIQNIYQKQFSVDIEKKSLSILNEVSNLYEITESSNQVIQNPDGKQSVSSKYSTLKTKEQEYLSIPIKIQNNYLLPDITDDKSSYTWQNKTHEFPNIKEQDIKSKNYFSFEKQNNIQQDQIQKQSHNIQLQDNKSKNIKGKFGIKNALKNIKKDVKQQQEELKSAIQIALSNQEQDQNNKSSTQNLDDQLKASFKQNIETKPKDPNFNINQDIQNVKLQSHHNNYTSHSNRTGVSNNSTPSQCLSTHPYTNLSIENIHIKTQPNSQKQSIIKPSQYIRELQNQTENTYLNIQIKNDQNIQNQDKEQPKNIRKSYDQQQQRQNKNNIYEEYDIQINNKPFNKLNAQKIDLSTLSQEFQLNQNTFFNCQPQSNNNVKINEQQINVRVRRSQSFKQ